MLYRIETFKTLGIYEERTGSTECSFEGGKVINDVKVSKRIKEMLDTIEGRSHNNDSSRQDSAVITALLNAGLSPSDTYATFAASTRGKDAEERKNSHFDDYLRRTIEKSVAFIEANPKLDKLSIDFANAKLKKPGNGLVVLMSNEVEVEKTNWVWPGYIPAGKLTLIAGDPGMGKSTMVGDIVSRISRGTFLPSGQRSITGTSLIASAEDSAEDTITPRLIACGANLKKVGIIREVRDDAEIDESRYLSFPRDLTLLKNTIISTGCRLLIIDPLTAFLEKGTDSYKDQDMRRVLHPIESIAQETGSAIVIVAHLNKKEDSSTLYRVGGSIGFIAAARSVLGVTRAEDDSRILYSLKCNLASPPSAMAYEIKQVRKVKTAENTWAGENIINSSAIRWLGEVDFNPFAKNKIATPESQIIEDAKSFLQELLRAGEMSTDQIYEEGKQAGVAKSSINKVKSILGIINVRRNNLWFWSLPETN